ncbi:MAG: divalent-cation tolerance protein CutA [Lentisphaerota bacterium]
MKMMMVYMTAKHRREALKIGRALVGKRLAACVNLLGPMESVYRWKGTVHHEKEVAFIAKTRASLVPKLIRAVRAMHRYECPCIVAWPLTAGHPAFLKWIGDETRPPV